ncbi:MFS transporter [Micromonospora sp. NPDC050397]|uniref:MFS transporter n=1 Tax=Micromonospora sp. NPDC050397 TaxID=3364279 RepID=UPI00384C0032
MRFLRGNNRRQFPRQFYGVWAAVTVSSLGDGMRQVALPLLTADLTDDARQVALVALAGQLPWFLVSLMSGVLADRLDRRGVLWFVDLARAAIMVGVAVLAVFHALSVPVLAGVAFLLGCGHTLYSGSWSGLVPSLVAPESLSKANARLQASWLVAGSLVGAPLGAVLFEIAPAFPLSLDAFTFICSAGLILLMPASPLAASGDTAPAGRSLLQDALDGLRWLWRHTLLRRVCATSALVNLVVSGLMSVLVLYARQTLDLGSSGYALLVTAFAVGGIAGVPLASYLETRFGPVRVLLFGSLVMGVIGAGIGLAGSATTAVFFVAAYGTVSLVWNVTAASLRQTRVPAALLGRVTMTFQMVNMSAGAVGVLLTGLVYYGIGPRFSFLAGAILLCLAGAFLFGSRVDATVDEAAAVPALPS